MELYVQVRRSVFVKGISEREAARRFGLARETVRKMLRYAVPPGYRRQQPVRRPKLDRYTGIIDQILEADQTQPKKQRHTAKRIFERLRDEHDFSGGYTIVKDYIREKKLGQQEMFVPLEHPPGDAQLSTVLRSKRAIQINLAIIRAFIHLRRNKRLTAIEKKLASHEKSLVVVFLALDKLKHPPHTTAIGFETKPRRKVA